MRFFIYFYYISFIIFSLYSYFNIIILFFISFLFFCITIKISFTIISLSSSNKFFLEYWFSIRNYYYITNYYWNIFIFILYIRY